MSEAGIRNEPAKRRSGKGGINAKAYIARLDPIPLFPAIPSMKIIAKLSMISLLMGPSMMWADPVDPSQSAVTASDNATQEQPQAPLKLMPLSQAEQNYIRECCFLDYPADIGAAKVRKTLQILLKGDWNTIDCYANDKERTIEERKNCYYDFLAQMLDRFCTGSPSEEKIHLTLEAVKERPSLDTFERAALIFYHYPEKKGITLPYLKEWMNWKGNPMAEDYLKDQVAYTLALFGEHDIALAYYHDLALSNRYWARKAIPSLFKCDKNHNCRLWDERGYQILKDALYGGTNEVKVLAAEWLIKMNRDGEESKKTLFSVIEELKFKTAEDYGGDNEHSELRVADQDRYLSDRRACAHAFHLLGQYEPDKIELVIKYLKNRNNEWWNVCR